MAAINFPANPGIGTIFVNVQSGFSYQWDGTVWSSYSPASVSNVDYVDDIATSFNGVTQTFPLRVNGIPLRPASPQSLLVSIGGVVQEPYVDYTVSDSNIVFSTPPLPGLFFFATSYGAAFPITQFSLANGVATEGDFNVSARLNVSGITSTDHLKVGSGVTVNGNSGIVSATAFHGDATRLFNVLGVQNDGTLVGVAKTLNFKTNLVATFGSGIATITGPDVSAISSKWTATSAGINTLTNVGIGTTNPTSKLTVSGDGRFTGVVTASAFSPSSGYIKAADGTNSIYIFNSTGNVSFQGNIAVNQINTGSGYKALDFSSTTTPYVNVTNGLNVGTGGTVIATNDSGNVGIGTTNATSRLTVSGGASISQLYVTGISTFRGSNNTNIHLGNTSYYSGLTWSGSSGIYTGTEPSILTNSSLGLEVSGGLGDLVLSAPSGTGNVILKASNTTAVLVDNVNSAQVELYYGGNRKFETIGTGVTVFGTHFTNELNVTGVSTHVGISTFQSSLFATQLSVSGVSTYVGISTFQSTLFTNQLSVSGVSTHVGVSTFQSTLFTNQLSVSGVSTFNNNVGIATTNAGRTLHVNGGIRNTSRNSPSTQTALHINTTTGDIAETASSRRFKRNIQDYEKGLETLTQLRAVSFQFLEDDLPNTGLIAEEVNALGLPEFIRYDPNGDPHSIPYDNLSALYINAIKQLKVENDLLKQQIAEIKNHLGLS